ncbi:Mor transcription activator family protein [Paraclostridium sordellii]|uniref:Mor transcription activator family protein n=1 Tax=Paraclostridium sordellii TaxID=1505 RepID=UPI0009D6D6BB|nr:Mor transcription activator family protein [Paeniclostridium sordellii]
MIQKSNKYKGIYGEMIAILGEDTVKKIHENYKGQQVTFPMKLYSKEYIDWYINANKDKKNVKQLSKELGYSMKWITNIMKNKK